MIDAASIAAVIVSISLLLYSAVVSYEGLGIAIDSVMTRAWPKSNALARFFEDGGIALAITGLTFGSVDLAILGILILALGTLMPVDDRGTEPSEIQIAVQKALLLSAFGSICAMAALTLLATFNLTA